VLSYINPHKVQLNTVVRPPAEKDVEPVSFSFLKKVAEELEVPAEVIVSSSAISEGEVEDLSEEELILRVVEYLKRRPAPAEELAKAFPVTKSYMKEIIEKLLSRGLIKTTLHQNKIYYVA